MKRYKIGLFSFLILIGLFSCQNEMNDFMINKENSENISTKSTNLYEKTVEVKEAGTLEQQLITDEIQKLEKLTIIGNLNAIDVTFFREKIPNLSVLNLKKVIFIENDTLTYKGFEWNPYWQNYYDKNYYIIKNTISASMFANMTGLTKVILPENITELGNLAFWNCKALTSVEFPEHIKNVGSRVFEDCKNLVSIDLSCFDELGEYMFSRTSLQTIILPTNTRTIPDCSFSYTGNLKITIPESVVKIGEAAFYGSELVSITIPSSVKDFGTSIFSNCKNLQHIELPTDMKTLPKAIFKGCTSLKNILLPYNLESISEAAFAESGLISLDMPNTVTTLEANSFSYCPLTEKVILSSSLKTIDRGVFEYCNFETILLPDKLETIKDSFGHNDYLKTLTIPTSVKSVGAGLISYCHNITSIFWKTTTSVPALFVWGGITSPNCLLYLSSEEINTNGCQLENIIINNECTKLTLLDEYPFHCPQAFKTREIIYTRNFQKTTIPGKSNGWYTLSLPFDVEKITYNDKTLTPFNQTNKDGLHFWLRTLTETGYKDVEKIEKDKPYIIAIPNNSNYYDEEYNVHGNVTFTAKNNAGITISKTTDLITQKGADYSLLGTFVTIPKRASAYPINNEGTAFHSSIKDVAPFEAYAFNNSLNSTTRSFTIGNGSQTRSFHPIGRKPTITDM